MTYPKYPQGSQPLQATSNPPLPRLGSSAASRALCSALLLVATAGTALTLSGCGSKEAAAQTEPAAPASGKLGPNTLQVTPEQAREVNIGPVHARSFASRREATGMIDFNQESTVQVFTPYQGRIGTVAAKTGDDVKAGQLLYTVQIPDLAQASATLISTSGLLKTANETLKRAQALYETQSIPLKELQQNTADAQTADANYRAALKVMSLFGLDPRDIQEIEAKRRVDTEMRVRSPIAGRVTARTAAPGLLVQPGNAPAPVTVSDTRNLWMVANVPESELASYRIGQKVEVSVPAYPDKRFAGEISYIGDSVDANTHRIALRAVVRDPNRLLRQQMMASFVIALGEPVQAIAIPANALVRETDGSFSVWVTSNDTVFNRRVVQPGERQDGIVEILAGLKDGERIAQDKALFLSNLYTTSTR